MSVRYDPVLWSRRKWLYDAALVAAAGLYVYVYIRIAPSYGEFARPVDIQITRMRATGTCAFLMLSTILCIGPLARLDRRFLPILYNRRHFGVLTFAMALAHASFVLDWYFSFSPTPRIEALLSANASYGQVLGFPFEIFGVFALMILFALAATSHDFWLSFLTPPVWKGLHMLIYPAYALVVAHIAFGYLQDVDNWAFGVVAIGAAAFVAGLHFIASARESARDQDGLAADVAGWVEACHPDEIPEKRAKIITLQGGERVAIFKYDGKISAITNVCAHQNGPLGEGEIIAGCVTCPWHGHQFDPATGRAPAPFTDKISTYRVMLKGGMVHVHERAQPPGAPAEPIILAAAEGLS